MQDTAGKVGTRPKVIYSCGPLHMDEQSQDDQLEPTYSSSIPTRDVALRTYRKQWKIRRGGERGSGISVLIARHDDDGDGSDGFFGEVVGEKYLLHKESIALLNIYFQELFI